MNGHSSWYLIRKLLIMVSDVSDRSIIGNLSSGPFTTLKSSLSITMYEVNDENLQKASAHVTQKLDVINAHAQERVNALALRTSASNVQLFTSWVQTNAMLYFSAVSALAHSEEYSRYTYLFSKLAAPL